MHNALLRVYCIRNTVGWGEIVISIYDARTKCWIWRIVLIVYYVYSIVRCIKTSLTVIKFSEVRFFFSAADPIMNFHEFECHNW